VNFSSKLLEEAVHEFAALPGVGSKTALRLVLHLLKQDRSAVHQFSHTFLRLKDEVRFCKTCHNISDQEICSVCSNPKRHKGVICVVEDIRDIMAIENTQQYTGTYHVLSGLIAPMEGIGPSDLNIESLVERARREEVTEVIMALSATMEGDTTMFYISKKLKDLPVLISTIARGIAFGGELEQVDELTLGRSILTRIPYENTLLNKKS
jgi:recombination protein RecR